MHMNLNVVAEEQHGLAQRSGSITAHIRIGDISSPVIPYGSADLILSMEAMESLRNIEFLKPNGFIMSSSRILHPVVETDTISIKRKENLQYVNLDQIKQRLRKITQNSSFIDSQELAKKAGNPRTENIVLLGAASAVRGFPLTINPLEEAVKKLVPPRTIKVNLDALYLGHEEILKNVT